MGANTNSISTVTPHSEKDTVIIMTVLFVPNTHDDDINDNSMSSNETLLINVEKTVDTYDTYKDGPLSGALEKNTHRYS